MAKLHRRDGCAMSRPFVPLPFEAQKRHDLRVLFSGAVVGHHAQAQIQDRSAFVSRTASERAGVFDAGDVVHDPEGVTINIELTAFQSRPRCDADADQPSFEARVTPLTIRTIYFEVCTVARIKLRSGRSDNVWLTTIGDRIRSKRSVRMRKRGNVSLRASTRTASESEEVCPSHPTNLNFGSLVVAIIGSIIALVIYNALNGRRTI